ncbi:MAG: hypothetical protein ACJ786_08070 [Catenulispora sp.]
MGKARKKRRAARRPPPKTPGQLRKEYAAALVQRTRLYRSLIDGSVEATSGSMFWLQTLGLGLLTFGGTVALSLFTLPILGFFLGLGAAVFGLTFRNLFARYRHGADQALSILSAVGFVLATLVGAVMARSVYFDHFGTRGVATQLENIGPSHAPRSGSEDRCVVRMPDQGTEIFPCLSPTSPTRTANGGYPVYYDTHFWLPPRVATPAGLNAGLAEGAAGAALALASGTAVVGLGRTRPGVLTDRKEQPPGRGSLT